MPYRSAAGILMALAGLVAVAGLVLIGIDVYAARQRGPRWKRRLLGAGLAVLGALGFGTAVWRLKEPVVSCYRAAPGFTSTAPDLRQRLPLLEKMVEQEKLDAETARKVLMAAEKDLESLSALTGTEVNPWMSGKDAIAVREAARPIIERLKARLGESSRLEESPDWKVITDAWDFAMPFARSGQSTTAQRQQVDAKLATARLAAARLVGAGLLAASEAGLLAAETEKIKTDVCRDAPTDRMVPCYEAMIIIPAQDSLARLNQRLPFLDALVKGGRIHKVAADKVLATIEADIATLSDEKQLGEIGEADKRAEAAKTRDAVKAAVEKLKALLGTR